MNYCPHSIWLPTIEKGTIRSFQTFPYQGWSQRAVTQPTCCQKQHVFRWLQFRLLPHGVQAQMRMRMVEGSSQAWLLEMINNPAEVSHKESLPVSPLTLEKPGVIMTCQHIWCERLTASPPNRASSGQPSPGRPPIFCSSCSPSFSELSVIILNSHITGWKKLVKCEVCFNSGFVHSYCSAENCVFLSLHACCNSYGGYFQSHSTMHFFNDRCLKHAYILSTANMFWPRLASPD